MVVIDCSKMSMKNGSKDITTLQKELNKLGYYKRRFDTVYGYYTKQGVKQFQKKYGLSQDGVFGPKTCKKLNEVAEEKNTTKTTTSTTATVSTKSIFDCPKISLKRSTTYSSDVKTLQSYLSQLKYYTRQVDGVFGEYTEKAVKLFQKDYKLKEDGWFAQLTCNKLTQVVASKNLTTTTSTSSSSATKTSTTYTPEYAKQTSATLTLLPEVVVLPVSELDEATNTKTVTGGSISTDTNFDCSKISLRRNSDSKEEVRKLQTLLASRGYYTRQIDGDFGKYTENAVKKLQSAQGNDPDGWFGPKTCAKLQGTSATSNTATGTADKKAKKHTITDIKVTPQITDDMDGLSHDITLQTPYSEDKFGYMRKLQKTIFEYKKDEDVIIHHEGYINEIKLSQEDEAFMIELQIVGYTAFLDMTVEFEKTAKRSVLIQDLAALCGLKAVVDTTGLTDDEYTIKVQKATTGAGNGATGLTQLSGNDCTGHYQTNSLSAWSNDIDKCGGNTKIGNSSANYATETAGMSGKEAILSIWNRFQYGKPGNSNVYRDNEVCPRQLWNKTGTVYGNCADISRLVKCVGEVHGLKVGIKHAPDHYYNLIEWEGKVHTFDCCYKSKRGWYAGEKNNTLCFFNGPWSNG